jgi:hypothetical protein
MGGRKLVYCKGAKAPNNRSPIAHLTDYNERKDMLKFFEKQIKPASDKLATLLDNDKVNDFQPYKDDEGVLHVPVAYLDSDYKLDGENVWQTESPF